MLDSVKAMCFVAAMSKSPVVNFFKGMLSVVTVTASPQLYRYPHRTSAEALRGDMQRVGRDIENVIAKLEEFSEPDPTRKTR